MGDETEMHRVLKVISDCELCLWHPVMEDGAAVWRSQVAMIEKRGGNLCAPIPRPLGQSGYLNDLSEEELLRDLQLYKVLCLPYPREGRGVEEHCIDVGLEDPQSKKMAASIPERFVVTPTDMVASKLGQAKAQNDMGAVAGVVRMLDGVDSMVAKYSSQPSEQLRNISVQTAKTNPMWADAESQGDTTRLMEAEMISGQADGHLVTLEREEVAAKMAAENWAASAHRGKIESRVGEAQEMLRALASEGASFDLVFLDVDKPGYLALYETIM